MNYPTYLGGEQLNLASQYTGKSFFSAVVIFNQKQKKKFRSGMAFSLWWH